MGRFWTTTGLVMAVIALLCTGFGAVAAVVGVPANYGLSVSAANELAGGRPVKWTVGWVVWAGVITWLTLARARHLQRHRPEVRATAARGAVWLVGAIVAPWFAVWWAWDIPASSHFEERHLDIPEGDGLLISLGVSWWLLGVAFLIVGAIWSFTQEWHLARQRERAEAAALHEPLSR